MWRSEAAQLVWLSVVVLAAAFVVIQGPIHGGMGAAQVGFGVAGGAWLLALRGYSRLPGSGRATPIVVGALALRLVVLAGDVELSDDRYRYAWEGGLVLAGTSPYAFAPDAPELFEERARWAGVHARMNNPEISAAYPPLTQAAAAAVVAAAGDVERAPFGMRLFFAACDLLVLWPLLVLLRRRGLPPSRAVAWAWSPLAAFEFAGSGHFDSLGILCLVAGLALFESRRASGAIGLLGAGILVKLLPVVAVPFALRRAPRRGLGLLVLAGVMAAGFLPLFLLEGGFTGLGRGLFEYGLRWESFNLLFRWIEPVFASWFAMDESLTDPRFLARGVVGLAVLAVGIREWRRGSEPARATFAVLAAMLVLGPTLHPWYLLWLLPLLALFPSPAFALLFALAPLFYWPLAGWRVDGVWEEPAWLWPVVATAFFGALAVEVVARLRRERGAA